MSHSSIHRVLRSRLGLLVALALLATVVAPTYVAAQEEGEERVIKIKKRVQCEGDDCPDGASAVFVSEDGEFHELHGEGHVWVSSDGDEHNVKVMRVGDGKDVKVMRLGGDGHKVMFGGGGGGPFLGVQLTELTDDLRAHFGVPEGSGVMVSKVIDDTAAFRAGIQAGDIITGINGQAVKGAGSLGKAIRSREDGETVNVELFRDGRMESFAATLENRPEARNAFSFKSGDGGHAVHMAKRIKVECDDEGDCDVDVGDVGAFGDFDCGSDECEINVSCTGGDCECTINGEPASCEGIPGLDD